MCEQKNWRSNLPRWNIGKKGARSSLRTQFIPSSYLNMRLAQYLAISHHSLYIFHFLILCSAGYEIHAEWRSWFSQHLCTCKDVGVRHEQQCSILVNNAVYAWWNYGVFVIYVTIWIILFLRIRGKILKSKILEWLMFRIRKWTKEM